MNDINSISICLVHSMMSIDEPMANYQLLVHSRIRVDEPTANY